MPKPNPIKIDPSSLEEIASGVIRKAKFPMLATMDGDQPRVRPVSPVRVEGFTIYLANLKSYQKTQQIQNNPNVELCYMDSEHNQVRITGQAETVNDRELIVDIWNKNKLLQQYLGSMDNPELIVYRIIPRHVRFMQEWALTYFEVPLS